MSEIGGEFHWPGIPSGPYITWPEPYRYFSTGRAIVVALAKLYGRHRLWLPSYFCPHTADYWESTGLQIYRYIDHPMIDGPDYATLNPISGDMVLALNLFGIRRATPWNEWHRVYAVDSSILLLEDHSHDPLSTWALKSNADYVFSSLRKTLPVPDGAIVWSPKGRKLPDEPNERTWVGSAKKLAAMIWKKEYLDRGEVDGHLKEIYRQLQEEGETEIENNPIDQISPWSLALLSSGIPILWRKRREANVTKLIKHFPASSRIRPLFSAWPEGNCPFNLVICAESSSERDALRKHLIDHLIFTPIHWVLGDKAHVRELELSRRLLTIPVDQRYTTSDIERIANIICTYVN